MNTTRRQFTDDFKREAVALLASSGRPLAHIAAELGIHASVLRNWRRRMGASAGTTQRPITQAAAPQRLADPGAEIARLKRENNRLRLERDILKKTGGHLLGTTEMKFRLIEDHREIHPVRVMCAALGVSPSGYYAWRRQPESPRKAANRRLLADIRRLHGQHRERYGAPRIHRALIDEGQKVSRSRVERLMRRHGIRAHAPRRFRVRTTDSTHTLPIAPNLLDQTFIAVRPNQVWLADITYVRTGEGWLYLAVVLDLFSRKVVGWAMRDHMRVELTIAALTMAIQRQRPPAGLIHHSDRGSQYAAGDYRDILKAAGIVQSMSRKGNCWDNAPMESFFGTVKTELVHRQDYPDQETARRDLFAYIEIYYNRQRMHSALGYLTPVQTELQAA
ncbi:MAG: IS3 family transposase [Alphaproteobacteria bacterium]|nr:IS3 family transposase [Alphaproteobacteria bacterium]